MSNEAMQTDFHFFEVGGCVRDELMGLSSKDVDFSVVAPKGKFNFASTAFSALCKDLDRQGFQIFEVREEFLTVRAKVPKGHPLAARTAVADFVLARKEGPYSDGRHPDWVVPGTLLDDLSRRDFCCNAISRDIDGNLVDPFDGVGDLQNNLLRFVGNPDSRIAEDGLRVMRGFRFHVVKGFDVEEDTWEALVGEMAARMLAKVSVERIREELVKMFRHDTLQTLRLLGDLPAHTQEAIFRDGLRLDATLAQ